MEEGGGETEKMLAKKKLVALAVVLAAVLVGGAFAATYRMWIYEKGFTVTVPEEGEGAVQYTVVTDLPETLTLEQEETVVVDCVNTALIPYNVWATLTIWAPAAFENEDIFVRWTSYRWDGTAWVESSRFSLGRGTVGWEGGLIPWGWHIHFDQLYPTVIQFSGTPTTMEPGEQARHVLGITILGTAPTGSYSTQVIVDGEGL